MDEALFNIYEFDFGEDSQISTSILNLWGDCFTEEYLSNEISPELYESFRNKLKGLGLLQRKAESYEKYKFLDLINLFVEATYISIKRKLKDFPTEFEFSKLSDIDKLKFSYCLKVSEQGKSVSGLISKIVINDDVSEKYSKTLLDLGITKIKYIDTYGLDHDKIVGKDELEERYKQLFTQYINVDAIFFIRAIGTDSPSDLQDAIPLLYKVNPSAVPYVVFTKLDENDISKLKRNSNCKAYDALFNMEPTLKETLCGQNVPSVLIDSRYKVLTEKAAGYCSKIDRKNDSIKLYEDMNQKTIRSLMSSIVNKEHLGSEIIEINNLLLNIHDSQTLKIVIKLFLDKSSKVWTSYSSRTIGANKKRLEKGELGYDGTYQDTLRSRLYFDGYNDTFTKLDQNTFEKCFGISDDTNEVIAVRELLNEFSKDFLGCTTGGMIKNFVKCSCENEENCIKNYLVINNPELNAESKFQCTTTPIYRWLTKVYDFKSYSNIDMVCDIFLKKFDDYFINKCKNHNERVVNRIQSLK